MYLSVMDISEAGITQGRGRTVRVRVAYEDGPEVG